MVHRAKRAARTMDRPERRHLAHRIAPQLWHEQRAQPARSGSSAIRAERSGQQPSARLLRRRDVLGGLVHDEQNSMIRRYSARRNRHAQDKRPVSW